LAGRISWIFKTGSRKLGKDVECTLFDHEKAGSLLGMQQLDSIPRIGALDRSRESGLGSG
jgi:hypothetical protein